MNVKINEYNYVREEPYLIRERKLITAYYKSHYLQLNLTNETVLKLKENKARYSLYFKFNIIVFLMT